MAYGVTRKRKIQLGKETTAGTAVAATVLWNGMGQFPADDSPREFVHEPGSLHQSNRSYQAALAASLNLESAEATYELLHWLLDAMINGVTASADGSGSGYTRSYSLNASGNDPETLTVEGGDNQDCLEMEYGFVTELVLSGQPDGAVMVESATIQGRQVSDDSFTADLSLPTDIEEILFNKGSIYIDDTGGSGPGTTQKTGTFLGFTLTITGEFRAVTHGDGNLYFTTIKQVGGSAECEIILEHDDTCVTERGNAQDGTERVIRIAFTGSDLETSDTYSSKRLNIDMCGVWLPDSFTVLEDDEGDSTMVGTLRVGYNSDEDLELDILLVNEIS
jgi:hypothetical protein